MLRGHSSSARIQSLCSVSVFYMHLVFLFIDFVLLPFTRRACHEAYGRSRVACEHHGKKDWKLFSPSSWNSVLKLRHLSTVCWKPSVVSRAWKENNARASHLFFYCFSLCNLLLAVYLMLIKQTPFINFTSLDIVSSANKTSAKNSHLLSFVQPELLLSSSHVLCK